MYYVARGTWAIKAWARPEPGLHWFDLSYKLMPVGWSGSWLLNGPDVRIEMLKCPAQYNIFNEKRCIYFTNGDVSRPWILGLIGKLVGFGQALAPPNPAHTWWVMREDKMKFEVCCTVTCAQSNLFDDFNWQKLEYNVTNQCFYPKQKKKLNLQCVTNCSFDSST